MLELYTDRLRVRSVKDSDWHAFYALHSDPQINQYVRIPDPEEVIRQKFLQHSESWFYGSGNWCSLVIETLDTNQFIGLTGFYCQSVAEQRAEVGYMLAKSAHGKGYATESLQALIDWACLSFNVHKFVGHCAKENHSSARVLQKCGFQLEGILREQVNIGGHWFDECAYGLLAAERYR